MADVKALAEELVNLSVKDVQELAKVLEEEYGIKPAAAAVVVAADGAGAGAAEAEQTEFDVVLKSRLSRSLRRLSDLVLRRLRRSLTAHLQPLRRRFPRQKPSSSRLPLRRLVPRSRLSNLSLFPA